MRYSGSDQLIEVIFDLYFLIFNKLCDIFNDEHDRLLILEANLPFLKCYNDFVIDLVAFLLLFRDILNVFFGPQINAPLSVNWLAIIFDFFFLL
jgi:hypothetical protein